LRTDGWWSRLTWRKNKRKPAIRQELSALKKNFICCFTCPATPPHFSKISARQSDRSGGGTVFSLSHPFIYKSSKRKVKKIRDRILKKGKKIKTKKV